MATKTPNLGLILEPTLTPSARANLLRLDSLGGALNLLNTQSVQFRAAQDVTLQPADVALGGTSGQGKFTIGSADNRTLTWQAYSSGQAQFDAPSLGLRNQGVGLPSAPTPARWLGLAYAAAAGATADRTLTLDVLDGNRSLTLGASLEVVQTGGAGRVVLSLSSATSPTLTVPASGILVLQDLAQVLTDKSISGATNTLSAIPPQALDAGIPATKLGTGTVDNTELGYLDGVTSPIQDQLNAKQPSGAYLTGLTGDVQATGPGVATATLQPGSVTSDKLANNIARNKLEVGTPGAILVNDASGRVTSTSQLDGATQVYADFGVQSVITRNAFEIVSGAYKLFLRASPLTDNTTLTFPANVGSNAQVLTSDGTGNMVWTNAGAGTVNSVALQAPAIFLVAGSPVTSFGTLSFDTVPQPPNLVWAGPTTAPDAQPTFRALVVNDLPRVPNATLANMPALTFKANPSGSVGAPQDISIAAATALLDTFNSSTKGLAPASPGGTTTYLRADGTWATVPPAGVQTLGTIDTPTKSANGAHISGTTLYLQNADASFPGLVSTGGQSIAGTKSFTTAPLLPSLTASLPLRLDGSNQVTSAAINLAFTDVAGILPIANGGTASGTQAGARTNLGLGGAAVLNVGTTAGTVAAGDDARFTAVTKYKDTWALADGVTKNVVHNLGTLDLIVQVVNNASGETIEVDSVVRNTTNLLVLNASEAPAAAGWRILILAL